MRLRGASHLAWAKLILLPRLQITPSAHTTAQLPGAAQPAISRVHIPPPPTTRTLAHLHPPNDPITSSSMKIGLRPLAAADCTNHRSTSSHSLALRTKKPGQLGHVARRPARCSQCSGGEAEHRHNQRALHNQQYCLALVKTERCELILSPDESKHKGRMASEWRLHDPAYEA